MTTLNKLTEAGQSPWLDFISKKIIKDGTLSELISKGITGLTSNPSIFDSAISKSEDYDSEIKEMTKKGLGIYEIYDELTVKDIIDAGNLFNEIYSRNDGKDGFVSLEVNPGLARNSEETIAEGKRLFKKVALKNLMIKVPATEEGFPAIEELIASGINVNATLIFSLEQYEKTVKAYMNGVKKLKERGGDPSKVHSVASVFISRIDTAADKIIVNENLRGKAAIANAVLIYDKFRTLFKDYTDGHIQRPLWASTGTKNPLYSDIKYIQALICPSTVNTMPETTLRAFVDHGKVNQMTMSPSEASDILEKAKKEGADITAICAELLIDGVKSFEKAFESLMGSISIKAGLTDKKQ